MELGLHLVLHLLHMEASVWCIGGSTLGKEHVVLSIKVVFGGILDLFWEGQSQANTLFCECQHQLSYHFTVAPVWSQFYVLGVYSFEQQMYNDDQLIYRQWSYIRVLNSTRQMATTSFLPICSP